MWVNGRMDIDMGRELGPMNGEIVIMDNGSKEEGKGMESIYPRASNIMAIS